MQVGRSVLQRVIARGGMAEIWLARQTGPRDFTRDVVIKRILFPSLRDRSAAADLERQFFDEARLASQLTHPNIVQVYEFDEFEGTPYLVMESLVGDTLAGLMKTLSARHEVMPAKFAVAIVDRCAQGLGSAHRKVGVGGAPLHIVHRDVSPQNIFVTREGIVKVLDFGIARAVGRVTSTAVGMVRGKPAYMAPEHALSEAVAASDVFALGVVLFELLTGTRLYGDVDHLTAFAMLVSEQPYRTPSSVNPALPAGLDALVARMMARKVSERFVDGVACADALAEWQWTNHGPVSEQTLSEWLRSLEPSAAVTLPAAAPVQLPASEAAAGGAPVNATVVASPAGAARRSPGSDAAARAAAVNATVVASPAGAARRSSGSDAAAAVNATVVASPGGEARRIPGSNAAARAAPINATLVPGPAPRSPEAEAADPRLTREAPATVTPTLILSDAEPLATPAHATPMPARAPTPARAPSTPTPAPGASRSAGPRAAKQRRSPWLLASGVALSLVLVGGVLASRDVETSPAPAPKPSPPPALAQPAVMPTPTPTPTPTPPTPTPPTPSTPTTPAPATLELRLSSTPDGAQVEVDGLLVGHTPLVVTGTEGAMLQLSLTAPGFTKLERRVLMSRQLPELTLALEKLRSSPRPPVKPTKPKPGLYDNPWE